jgi:hypothetical protein
MFGVINIHHSLTLGSILSFSLIDLFGSRLPPACYYFVYFLTTNYGVCASLYLCTWCMYYMCVHVCMHAYPHL